MKRKIVIIILFMLLLVPFFSTTVAEEPQTELELRIFGGFPLPFIFHSVGGSITNIGSNTANNITYTMTIKGGLFDMININFDGTYEEIIPGNAISISTPEPFGFGPVTVTFTADASNADRVNATAKGFQLRDFTWIPYSWIKN